MVPNQHIKRAVPCLNKHQNGNILAAKFLEWDRTPKTTDFFLSTSVSVVLKILFGGFLGLNFLSELLIKVLSLLLGF